MRALGVALIVGLAGCGSNYGGPSAVPIGGVWSYQQAVEGGGSRCGESGQIDLTQSKDALGGTFNARGGCDTPGQGLDFIRSGNLESGRIDGYGVSFTMGACRYQGTVVGNPGTQAGGIVTCNGLPGTIGALLGSWEMRR